MREVKRFYQYGSVAEAPEMIFNDPYYEERKREEKRRKINEQKARRRAHKRSLRAAKLRAFSMFLGVFMISTMLFGSVYLQNRISETKKAIATMEDELNEVNMTNAAAKSRIETAVDLNAVKAKATQDMGMVYAGSDHIVYYEMGKNDYMIKY